MKQAAEFGKALSVQRQAAFADISLQFHERNPNEFDPTTLLHELQKQHTPFEYAEGLHMEASFGHLEGYSAVYYTYMWSLVIAKDFLGVFKKNGMMNKEIALQYKEKILKPGGTKDANELVRDFLGRDYSFDAFEAWLEE